MNISGIYQIQSKTKPERIYIGSAISVYARIESHKQFLRKNNHHSLKLQRHYNKYGEDDLLFSVLEHYILVDRTFILSREQYYIDTLKPYFNICEIAGNSMGVKRSEEMKEKLRKIRIGSKMSAETRAKISLANSRRVVTEETKRKLSFLKSGEKSPNFGKSPSFETRQKQREKLLGRKMHTKESKKAISLSKLGVPRSQEVRRHLSAYMKGLEPDKLGNYRPK